MSEDDFARWEGLEAEARTEQGPPARADAEPDAIAPSFTEATAEPEVEASPAPTPVIAGDAPAVLIADSDPGGRHIMAEAFRAQGWRTRLAIDGTEALIEVYRERPDCLVLDLALEGMSGLDLLRRIQAEAVVEDLCVVAHSSLSEPMHVHQAKALGAARFLDRDVDRPDALVDAVRGQLVERSIAVPEVDSSEVGDQSASGFRSPFGRGGGPPGLVPEAVRKAALGRTRAD